MTNCQCPIIGQTAEMIKSQQPDHLVLIVLIVLLNFRAFFNPSLRPQYDLRLIVWSKLAKIESMTQGWISFLKIKSSEHNVSKTFQFTEAPKYTLKIINFTNIGKFVTGK